jgi:hypothetical protein
MFIRALARGNPHAPAEALDNRYSNGGDRSDLQLREATSVIFVDRCSRQYRIEGFIRIANSERATD